jgi:hypothetical protein
MKRIIILLILSGLFTCVHAQQITVALHHNGGTTMFYGNSSFSDANTAAANGDTIYLPGKAHYSGITISKKLVIIGAGINPDSTIAIGRSLIESDIYFAAGSDGSVLEGIYTGNNIHFNGDTRINNVVIRRCYFSSLYFDGSFDTTHTCKREVIEQNVITGEIACDNSDYIIIRNNFIQARIRDIAQNGLIENNILYYTTDWGYWSDTPSSSNLYSVTGSLIRNNIFMKAIYRGSCCIVGSNNDVMNNIFAFNATDCWSSNYSNNYVNISSDTIFVGQTAAYTSFDFSQNYHLKSSSSYPGYANAGVGIYGGTLPLKEGTLPFNPHIVLKTIAPNTDNGGNLNINIKVKAQNN